MKDRVEIELLTHLNLGDEQHKAGDVLEVPAKLARELMEAGSARVPVEEPVTPDELTVLTAEINELRHENAALTAEVEELREQIQTMQRKSIGTQSQTSQTAQGGKPADSGKDKKSDAK